MKTRKILIVSDAENQNYWSTSINEIKKKVGPVRIVSENDLSWRRGSNPYDVIVVDISDVDELYRLIPEIHHEQPKSRIIIVSSTPTWKLAREVIRLGAANLIHKSSNQDDVINELKPQQICSIQSTLIF